MITIRHNIFETNSSSTHTFIIPRDGALKIPKQIKMSELRKFDNLSDGQNDTKDKLSRMYEFALDNNCESEFLDYLRSKGITIINDLNINGQFNDSMFGHYISEEDLDNLLFNDSTIYRYNKLTTLDERKKLLENDESFFEIKE